MNYKNYILPQIGSIERPIKLGVLISGSGSGMEALLNHQNKKKDCFHETVVVISNKAGVKGLERAQSKGIPTSVVEVQTNFEVSNLRKAHEKLIQLELEKHNVDVVILSGYMRILSPFFVERWIGRLLNIHPSLLPKFPGAHAHEEVLTSGVNETGCTVHFVDNGVDTGPIIAQKSVKVYANDTLNDLQERVKIQEHIIYPKVIDALCEGRLQLQPSGEVIIQGL
tara:strand:- start:964 stop:1638 length:675 start_codon:yes stop_codon:yes gene_type:complete